MVGSDRRLGDWLSAKLTPELARMPDGFFDSFAFTQTGRNYTHPLMLGLLARTLWTLDGVANVGVDVRFNLGQGTKFQPDLAAFDAELQSIVCVDYESPSSSDARIPEKDVDSYVRWRKSLNRPAPLYVILTTLPDGPAPGWELRYTAAGQYNEAFRGREAEVRANPLRFWRTYYERALAGRDLAGVVILNVGKAGVSRVL